MQLWAVLSHSSAPLPAKEKGNNGEEKASTYLSYFDKLTWVLNFVISLKGAFFVSSVH